MSNLPLREVGNNVVNMYFLLLQQDSTFKWDTCGPHAILNSLGTYVTDFKKSVKVFRDNQDKSEKELCALLEDCALKYDKPDSDLLEGGQKWSNSGGIIAFSDIKVLLQILQKLI